MKWYNSQFYIGLFFVGMALLGAFVHFGLKRVTSLSIDKVRGFTAAATITPFCIFMLFLSYDPKTNFYLFWLFIGSFPAILFFLFPKWYRLTYGNYEKAHKKNKSVEKQSQP